MIFRSRLHLLMSYLRPEGGTITLLLFLLIGTIGAQIGNPLLLRQFIDTALNGGALSALLLAAAFFLSIGLINQALVVATAYVSGKLAWRVTNRLREDLVTHCLQLDMSFHNTHTPGELLERTDEDVSTLANLFSLFVVQVLVNLFLLCGILLILFIIEWRLGLTMIIYSLVCLIVFHRTRNLTSSAWEKALQAKAELHGFVGEHITGVADIRTSGAISYIMRSFYALRRVAFLQKWYAHWRSTVISGLTDILLVCGTIGAFLFSIALFQAGLITLGTVYLVVTYTQLLGQPLQNIQSQLEDLRMAGASLNRIQALYTLQSSIKDGSGGQLAEKAPAIHFANVSFAYQAGVPVLKDITLHLAPGEVLCLLGRTGSGKTTVSRLLFRLYDPSTGTILLDDTNIQDIPLAQLRRHIGMVTQEVQLFRASLRDNLTFFARDIPDERIVSVLNEIGLSEWYNALPQGLNTTLASGSEEEAGYSAGEAQLLAFARLFLLNPHVVILDEASSRLDPTTEHQIDHLVERLLAGRTCMIIAHRLSTITRADKIAILQDGGLLEYGTRADLLRNPHSHLHHLLRVGLQEVQA